jgi:hypothetical protein
VSVGLSWALLERKCTIFQDLLRWLTVRYFGYTRVWAISSAIGPPIGGALATGGNWRWLFCKYTHACRHLFKHTFLLARSEPTSFRSCYPSCVLLLEPSHAPRHSPRKVGSNGLDVSQPHCGRRSSLLISCSGNFIIILSTTLCIFALSWAGTKYPWSSYRILVPLVLGLVGIGIFIAYERYYAKEPVVPFVLLSNRSSLSGSVFIRSASFMF